MAVTRDSAGVKAGLLTCSIIGLGLIIAILVFTWVGNEQRQDARNRFEDVGRQVAAAFERNLLSSGKCLERALRKRPDIRYLFVSGNPDNAVFGEDGLFDISQVLKKPFRQRELSERVRAVLDAATE